MVHFPLPRLARVSRSLPTMSRLAAALALALALSGRCAQAASIEAQVRTGAGKTLADVIVYALPANAVADARGKTVPVEQLEREFVPYVTAVQAGTTVTFSNRDPILHHVYSFSPPQSFQIKLYSGKAPRAVLVDKPGV